MYIIFFKPGLPTATNTSVTSVFLDLSVFFFHRDITLMFHWQFGTSLHEMYKFFGAFHA